MRVDGTNGIQAIDLVMRKVPMRAGGVVADLLAQMEALGPELDAAGLLPAVTAGAGPLFQIDLSRATPA